MPWRDNPTFSPKAMSQYEIPSPGRGGLNMAESEYNLDPNQSPYMLNMMYDGGVLHKRYGQEVEGTFDVPWTSDDHIHAFIVWNGIFFSHERTNMHYGFSLIIHGSLDTSIIKNDLPDEAGLFVTWATKLYYFIDGKIYEIRPNGGGAPTMTEVEETIPTILVNCRPDGSHADAALPYNVLSDYYYILFNGDGTSTDYILYGEDIDSTDVPLVWVNDIPYQTPYQGQMLPRFSYNRTTKTITFDDPDYPIPTEGINNVKVRVKLVDDAFATEREEIISSTFYASYGSGQASRLFLANGNKVWYSEAIDILYFPDSNYIYFNDSEGDITGFGNQYDRLMVFKENRIYALESYIQDSYLDVVDQEAGTEAFRVYTVNTEVGCSSPYSIQLIDNQLTWFNAKKGVCTLSSSAIKDERNVQILSVNVNKSNGSGIPGLLNHSGMCYAADWNDKYILAFRDGWCYVWDYKLTPHTYRNTYNKLAWFVWNNIYVGGFANNGDLYHICSYSGKGNYIIKWSSAKSDPDYPNMHSAYETGVQPTVPIEASYQTPAITFGSTPYLKTVWDIFARVQNTGTSVINVYYYTDVDTKRYGLGSHIWEDFEWHRFQWLIFNWANVFRKRCNLRKIQMAAFRFENVEEGQDMSITNVTLQYEVVKEIK